LSGSGFTVCRFISISSINVHSLISIMVQFIGVSCGMIVCLCNLSLSGLGYILTKTILFCYFRSFNKWKYINRFYYNWYKWV